VLLHYGADVNAVDQFQCTPLHYQDSVECFLYLVQRGANLHAKCKDNAKMPFDIICHHYYYGLVNIDERFGGANNGSYYSGNGADIQSRYSYYGADSDGDHVNILNVPLHYLCGGGQSGAGAGAGLSRRLELIRLLVTLHDLLQRRYQAEHEGKAAATEEEILEIHLDEVSMSHLPSSVLQSIMSTSNWEFLSNVTTIHDPAPVPVGGWGGVTAGTGHAAPRPVRHIERAPADRMELFHGVLTYLYRQQFMRFVCGYQLDHHWMLFNDDFLTETPSKDSIVTDQTQQRQGGLYQSTVAITNKETDMIYSSGNMTTIAHFVFSNEILCQKIMNYYV